jgi:hypothetical protein
MDDLRPAPIIRRALSFVGTHWVRMIVPTMLLIVLPDAITGYLTRAYSAVGLGSWKLWAVQAASPAIMSVRYLFSGWLAVLAADEASPVRPGGFRRRGTAVAFLWSVIPAAYILYVGYFVGFLLFIVPGVIFGLAASMTIQAMAVEGLGPLAAIKRSFELTRGRRGALFGIALTFFVPATIVSLIGTELISGWQPLPIATRNPAVVFVWQPLIFVLMGVLGSAMYAMIYVELAGLAKVGSSAQIAAEFD